MSRRRVVSDPADENFVLAGDAVRCRIELGVRVVLDHDTRRLREQPRASSAPDLLGRLDEHRPRRVDRHWTRTQVAVMRSSGS